MLYAILVVLAATIVALTAVGNRQARADEAVAGHFTRAGGRLGIAEMSRVGDAAGYPLR